MRIAICDDDPKTVEELQCQLQSYFRSHPEAGNVHIASFFTAEALLFASSDSRFDIFILDIDLPGINGIRLAQKIRQENPLATLFFYTSHQEYVLDGYKVDAIRYVLKSPDPSALFEALDSAVERALKQQRDSIIISHYSDQTRVARADILYIQHLQGKNLLHLVNGDRLEDRRRLQDLYRILADSRFYQIDRGTIVNTDYIQRTDGDHLILYNGERLYISRRKMAAVKQYIASIWR